MNRLRRRIVGGFAVFAISITNVGVAFAQDSFEGWNLEPGLGQAHLVMVARVASIGQLTIVQGAKTETALREYRFQPVRKLKGIFQRDLLSMTASDLGCPAEDPSLACPLKEGEFRLLILAQQQGRTWGCVSAASGATTFGERVPRVTGPDDPLVGVVETLIQVADSRSRRERADLLVRKLEGVGGTPAIPLLTSLRLRAEWAAADERALPSLTRPMRDPTPAVRSTALDAIRDVLACRIAPNNPQQLVGVSDALRDSLKANDSNTLDRLTALDSLRHLLALKTDVPWALELLIAQSTAASTYAERTAAVAALAQIKDPKSVAAVHEALAKLPLDEQPTRVSAYARAAVRLDAPAAERILLARLDQAIRARQALEAVVESLGRMRSKVSLPLLLTAAGQASLASGDRHQIARALGRLADDRAVPVLSGWLRSDDYQLREISLTSLELIDSPLAAREARPMLKSEAHLPYKLRIARLLARHELPDGYALATEHLADVSHTAEAALVLAALGDARTTKELTAIIAARRDRRWHAAALAGLAAIGDAAGGKQLLAILSDDRNPLTPSAAVAVGLVADSEFIRPLAALVQSRNKQTAMASLVALRRFLTGVRSSPRGLAAANQERADQEDGDPSPRIIDIPAPIRNALGSAVATLVVDANVEADVRLQAFAVARLLRGDGFSKLLSDLADQADLEGSTLLTTVEADLRGERNVNK